MRSSLQLLVGLIPVMLAMAADPTGGVNHATSPSEIVNAQIPQWVRLSGELRAREEGFFGNHFTEGNDDMYLLQRVRIGVELRPTQWLTGFVQAQDARVSFEDRVPAAPPLQDSLDLRQAYVQLGGESHLLSLRVGRQDLAFGEERLVGASNWGNVARSFDAIRLGMHHGKYRFDAFASSVVVPRDHDFDKHAAGDNLHGIYGQIDGWIPKSRLEPFVFWRLAPSVVMEGGSRGHLDSKTIGIRWAGSLPAAFEYTVEMAGQRGSWGADDVQAWAGFWRVGREFKNLVWNPRLRLEVNHASGDAKPVDGRHGTFDVLYPTAHDKYGMTDQVGWKNVNHVGVILEMKPRPNLVLQAKGHDWWLDSATDGLYNSGGALLVRDATGQSGKHIGQEIDLQAIWTPSKHLALGGGVGHMFTGSFLKKTTPGHAYTFPYIQLTYAL
ncbi:MAG TPA: alginate export family protein [Bryobacteraceae bacterium]|nr:alginate export family protein [Bryobacteraceae bacterium]